MSQAACALPPHALQKAPCAAMPMLQNAEQLVCVPVTALTVQTRWGRCLIAHFLAVPGQCSLAGHSRPSASCWHCPQWPRQPTPQGSSLLVATSLHSRASEARSRVRSSLPRVLCARTSQLRHCLRELCVVWPICIPSRNMCFVLHLHLSGRFEKDLAIACSSSWPTTMAAAQHYSASMHLQQQV